MTRPLQGLLAAAAIAGSIGILLWVFVRERKEISEEQARERPIQAPPRVSRTPGAETAITLDRETQERIGLVTQALAKAELPRELTAYGRLQEDPSRSFLLRASMAGTLQRSPDRDWPAVGEELTAGAVIGMLEPRWSAAEQVDLSARLAAAQAEVDASSASAAAARASFSRAKTLNAQNKNVSDRVLEEAAARLQGEEARLRAASETVRLIQAALSKGAGKTGLPELRIGRSGQVTEVFAQPGEAVESGQPILRLSHFDQLLARVDLPAGESLSAPARTARLVVFGHEDQPLLGERVAAAAAVDPRAQGQGFVFRVRQAPFAARPGQAVTAYLRLPGAPERGVVVPAAAIVRFGGKAWVYVQTAGEQFSRREITPDRLTEKGVFVMRGVGAGDRIVTAGAQTLLSEEFKQQIQLSEATEQ
jgi:RND family efflux transporter MFP subunit